MIKQQIERDLKQAMLSGDKSLVSALKNIKSAIGYSEVAANKREEGLSEAELISLLRKESKKRQDAADLYTKASNQARAQAEIEEKLIIDKYLPKPMSQEEVIGVVDQAIKQVGEISNKTMGSIIAAAKKISNDRAEGSEIAKIVQQRLKG